MPDESAFETALATALGVIDTLERPGIGRPERLARVTYAILDAIQGVGVAGRPESCEPVQPDERSKACVSETSPNG